MINLNHWVRKYNRVSDKVCRDTIKELEDKEFTKHTFYNPTTNETYSNDNELSIAWHETSTRPLLNDIVDKIAHQYIQGLSTPWFTSHNNYSYVRFNKYDVNTKMAVHCDHIHSVFKHENSGVPILSVLGLLNDDFEGGEFIINSEKIDLQKGDLLVFPSNFMYPHEVMPITKGVRYSFISWIW